MRGCWFEESGVTYFNEDEGVPGAEGLAIRIYRNVFANAGGGDSFYQGGNNDTGIDDPGNTFFIFNNTFIGGRAIAQGGSTSLVQFYDAYVRNNVFIDSRVAQHTPEAGHVHVWSNNAFWNTTGELGTDNITGDPNVDSELSVQNPAFHDTGTPNIGPGITLTAGGAFDQFLGTAPDVGATEY